MVLELESLRQAPACGEDSSTHSGYGGRCSELRWWEEARLHSNLLSGAMLFLRAQALQGRTLRTQLWEVSVKGTLASGASVEAGAVHSPTELGTPDAAFPSLPAARAASQSRGWGAEPTGSHWNGRTWRYPGPGRQVQLCGHLWSLLPSQHGGCSPGSDARLSPVHSLFL